MLLLVLGWKNLAGAQSTRLPYIHIYPFNRALTTQDLVDKTPMQRRLIRNAIFARHGRPFKDPQLAGFFGGQSWYRKNSSWRPQDEDRYLSPLEKQNAQFVLTFGEGRVTAAVTDVDKAMGAFINAVRRRDHQAALNFIPRSGTVTILNTLIENPRSDPNYVDTVRFSQFRKDKGWIDHFFVGSNAGTPSLVEIIRSPRGNRWIKASANKFIPAFNFHYMDRSQVYFAWRKEGRKWVITEIGFPVS
jgi:hypothetical protein